MKPGLRLDPNSGGVCAVCVWSPPNRWRGAHRHWLTIRGGLTSDGTVPLSELLDDVACFDNFALATFHAQQLVDGMPHAGDIGEVVEVWGFARALFDPEPLQPRLENP